MRPALILAAALLAHPAGITAQSRSAAVSAKAMAYGEALHERASLELTAWADQYVQQNLVDHSFHPKQILAAVDGAFPDRRPPRRNAIVFLVLYRAFHAENENQRALGHLVQQHEAEALRLREEIDRLSAQRRPSRAPSSTNVLPPPNTAESIREREAKLNLETFRLNSRTKQLASSRRRVNLILRLINHSYPFVQNVPPEIVADARPGPSPSM